METLKELGIVALVIAAILLLAKWILNLMVNRDLERFKNDLRIQSEGHKLTLAKEAEHYKSELNILSNRQFKLDEKRATVIADLYQKIAIFYQDLVELTALFKEGRSPEHIEEKDQKMANETVTSGNNFIDYYSTNKIYFSSETCTVIQKFIDDTKGAFHDYIYPMRFPTSMSPDILRKRHSASKKVRDEIPKLLEAIEEEFRKLTGVK